MHHCLPRPLRIPLALLFIAGLALSHAAAHAQPDPPSTDRLAALIDSTLDHPDFDGSHWGVAVMNLRADSVLYARHPDRRFVPASNAKLFTTAAALEQLGPDFRYQTDLLADGTIDEGILQGRLIIRGAGDPTLGGYAQRDDPTAIFRAWADSLRTAGITRITGNIVGDDDIFTDTPLGHGWSWDDTPYAYAAELSGLAFNQNKVDITLEGQRVGNPARVHWEPHNTRYVNIVNRATTIERGRDIDEEYERPLGTNRLVLHSEVPVGRVEEEELAIHNPTQYAAHVFKEILALEDIDVAGQPVDIDSLDAPLSYNESAPLQRVARYSSPPLEAIVQSLNRESLNLYAEHVLRTLGVEHPVDDPEDDATQPGSAEMGIEAAMRTFAAARIDTSRIQLADGSGLSRHNLLTPRAIVALLQYMWQHPDPDVAGAFHAALAVGGQNGTLEYRYQDGARARGQVRAKTGTLSNVSVLSGYITTAAGTPLAFSILCNQHLTKTRNVHRAQDRIVNALAGTTY